MAEAYHAQALDSDEALSFYDQQGVSEKVLRQYQLGWITEAVTSNHAHVEGMEVIPYIVAQGRVKQLRAGAYASDTARRFDLLFIEDTWEHGESSLHLYNVGNAMPGLRTDQVHLFEGVGAVLRARSEGLRAVGVPGWENWHTPWVRLFSHSRVVLNHDRTRQDAVEELQRLLARHRIPYTEKITRTVTE